MSSQLSVQTFAQNTSQAERDALDQDIGLIGQITDPVNIFFSQNDLMNLDMVDYIYFSIYTIGKNKLILWGVYNLETHEFEFDAACRYTLPQLMPIFNTWKRNRYIYAGNNVVDRARERLTALLPEHNTFTYIDNYETYRRLKYLTTYFGQGTPVNRPTSPPSGILSQVVQSFNPRQESQQQSKLQQSLLTSIRNKIQQNLPQRSKEEIRKELEKVLTEQDFANFEQMFVDWLQRVYGFEPDEIYDLPEGRTIFDDYPQQLQRFVSEIQQEIAQYEQVINRIDVDRAVNELVAALTQRFYQFFVSGPFNFASYVNSLPPCPPREACSAGQNSDNQLCDLYNYGTYPHIYQEDFERRRQAESLA